ncbi:HD family phosphohydrolase [Enterococcus bulliens]
MIIQPLAKLHQKMGRFFIPTVLVFFFIISTLLLYPSVQQKSVSYQEGQVAEENIRANKTIENTNATEQKRKLAAEAVTPEYTYQSDMAKKQYDLVNNLFTLILRVKDAADKSYQQKVQAAKNGTEVVKPTVDELITALKKEFKSIDSDDLDFYQSMNTNFLQNIFTLSSAEIATVRDQTLELMNEQMSKQIKSNEVETARQTAENQLDQLELSVSQASVIRYLLSKGIVANTFLNEKRTTELQNEAKDAIQPVMIYQGEIIVREGSQIDQTAIEKLKLLGLTNKNKSYFSLVAVVCAILLQIGMLIFFVKQMEEKTKATDCYLFYMTIMTLSMVAMKFFQLFQSGGLPYIPLFFPAAFAPLVLNLFMNRRSGLLAALFQVIFAMFIFNNTYSDIGTNILIFILLSYLFSGVIGAIIRQQRISEQLVISTMWLVIFPLLMNIMLVIYQGMSITEGQTWIALACALAGTLLSLLLTMGLHQYIELLVTDDSVIVLNELSNPNHPLLKRLLEEAPGTYHHSMMVANLSANAVAAIGGNSLLTRVACYYHDIGKLKHANFFVENLPAGAENPHNFLLPEDSRDIIFGHVLDGAEVLEKERMPQMVIDICRQHHGTTLMKFFYVKAKERNDQIEEADFRYPGPKPQSKEAGVVSIADSCEAAVRAMDHPSNEDIKRFVSNLIKDRILDGQLEDSGLTLKEIRLVEESLVNGLCSTFHSRIKYPKMKPTASQDSKKEA